MSTTTNVQQVKVNLMTQNQYDLATKNPNEFYVITDSNYVEDSEGVLTIQPLTQVTYNATQSITLTNDNVIYKITPTGAITSMSFSLSNTTEASSTRIYTFELLLDRSSNAYAIAFPSNVTWMNEEAPDLSETGRYFLAFRTLDGGTTWLGNLQGKW